MRTFSSGFIILFVLLLLGMSWATPCPAASSADDPFVAVFVDDATEKVLGPFPYDRSVYAKALKSLKKAGAKTVILKFFLDKAKPGTGDNILAAEMKEIPVLLQARLDPKEHDPNPMPEDLDRSTLVQGDTQSLLSGNRGWIPLGKFSRNAAGLGFVDIASIENVLNIPMVLSYQGALLPSLELAAVEYALGQKAYLRLGDSLTLAGHTLPLGATGEITIRLPAKDSLTPLSFLDVLKGNFDPKRIQGKIVVLGFDAQETPTLPTPGGPMRIHRFFFYAVENLYEQLVSH